uniref:Uncharacterized protein n=1 Tax=Arundo donax TaxID=35708 RepID=A0A0A9CF62_ARUDO
MRDALLNHAATTNIHQGIGRHKLQRPS